MYRLVAKVVINSEKRWEFTTINTVKVVRDMDSLTGECTLTLPRRLRWDGQTEVPLRRGDEVKVWLGYDDCLELAFQGYIRQVGVKTPIVIECEDEMYQMKLLPAVKKAYRSVTLKQLLEDQGTGCRLRIMGEQGLGQYRVTATTVAELLSDLQKQGIKSFFRYEGSGPVLYSGVLFDRDKRPTQVFRTGVNIISDQLEQQHAEAMRLRVKVVSLMPNNKKNTVEVGDKDGELRTLHCYNKTEDEARKWGEQEVKRLKRDGLSGSFTTFGYHLVDVLDPVGMVIDGKRMGIYQVTKNTITFGLQGYRQELELGQRVS
ncbi:MAG: hypothetical protein IJT48_10725 [Bacteroidaceae bacterium]|nr:hypothetical protein [Bacteroidaceae bacterium]